MTTAPSLRVVRWVLGFALGGVLAGLPPEGATGDVRTMGSMTSAADGRSAAAVLSPFLGQAACPRRLEAGLLADAADGTLDGYSYLAAALVAGGLEDPAELRWYEDRAAQLVEELRGTARVSGPPRRRAQVVFEFMHARILRGGYAIDCTDLKSALDEGRFNCVSATVLYCHLAAQFGLEVRGLERPGHVMCRLVLPDQTLDIETTCPCWPRAVRPCAAQSPDPQVSRLRQSAEPAHAVPCREVVGPELIATVYYNWGVDLLGRGEFGRAVSANLRAWELDPSNRTARGNLLASLNNWAVHEGSKRRFAEAVDLLGAGLALEPDFKTFAVNYVYVHRQWASMLRASGRWTEAALLVQRASADPLLAGRISP